MPFVSANNNHANKQTTELLSLRFIHVFCFLELERFSLDCRKTKTKVNTLANQRG